MSNEPRQLQLDFTRAERDGLLKDVLIPKGLKVNRQAIAFVMNRIALFHDQPNGCYETVPTFALRGQMSTDQAERSLKALRYLGLLSERDSAEWEPREKRKFIARWIYFPGLETMAKRQEEAKSHSRERPEQVIKAAPTSITIEATIPALLCGYQSPQIGTEDTRKSSLPYPQKQGTIPANLREDTRTIVRDIIEVKELETTTEDEWVVVVSSLKSVGNVFAADKAIEDAKARGAVAQDVLADIDHYRSLEIKPDLSHLIRWIQLGSRPRDEPSTIRPEQREKIDIEKRKQQIESMRCALFREDRNRWSNETDAAIAQETYHRLGWSIDVEGKPIATNATPPPNNVGTNEPTTPAQVGKAS